MDEKIKHRILVKINTKYVLQFTSILEEIKKLDFEVEIIYKNIYSIVGYANYDTQKIIKDMPEVRSVTSYVLKKAVCRRNEHNKIYSGDVRGGFPRYFLWVCSDCGQLEFEKTNYLPIFDKDRYEEIINKFLKG